MFAVESNLYVPQVDNTVAPANDPYHQWHLPPLTAANDNGKLPRIVALAGVAGSGKSTLADYLVTKHGYQRVKFAGPLKAMCRAIGMTDAMIEGDQKELPVTWLQGRSPRYVMQRLGGDWGRDLISPDLWTGLWEKAANDILRAGGRVVTDDCRYDNEAYAIQALGGLVIKLQGRGGIGTGHASEQITDEVDVVLRNQGTIKELYDRLDEVLFGEML